MLHAQPEVDRRERDVSRDLRVEVFGELVRADCTPDGASANPSAGLDEPFAKEPQCTRVDFELAQKSTVR